MGIQRFLRLEYLHQLKIVTLRIQTRTETGLSINFIEQAMLLHGLLDHCAAASLVV